MGRARDLANILSSSGNVALDSELGLSLITPTSIAATGGSGSISTTGTVSFTSASAISLNGVFSSTYNNYKIVVSNVSGNQGSLALRLRADATDLTSSIYDWQETLGNGGSMSMQRSTSTSSGRINGGGTQDDSNTIVYLFDPFLARNTTVTSIGMYASGGNPLSGQYAVNIRSAVSYNGFTLFAGGNFNATISVYGYRK
jgi:hypothetical protein